MLKHNPCDEKNERNMLLREAPTAAIVAEFRPIKFLKSKLRI